MPPTINRIRELEAKIDEVTRQRDALAIEAARAKVMDRTIDEQLVEIDRLTRQRDILLVACEAAAAPYEIVWLTSPTRELLRTALAAMKHPATPGGTSPPGNFAGSDQ